MATIQVRPWYPMRTVTRLVVAVLGVASPLHGQGIPSLTGRVVDAVTDEPVQGALVAIETANGLPVTSDEAGLATVSRADGGFVLAPVPEGGLTVRAQHAAYGVHRQDLRVEGAGSGQLLIRLSVVGIQLEPIASSDGSSDGTDDGSRSARNVIGRPVIEEALATALDLTELLVRNVPGINVRRGAAAGGLTCIEFRGARRGPDACQPPALMLDGIPLVDPLALFARLDLSDLEEIRVVSPAEAGTRYGTLGGWGVVLLTSRRAAGLAAPLPVVQRSTPRDLRFAWNEVDEGSSYPWLKVYSAGLAGNAVGLAVSGALLSRCMDLGTRRLYRGDDYCGALPLLGAGIVTMVLPPLLGSLSARQAGASDVSRGVLGRSMMLSLPAMVPTLALATTDAGSSGLTGLEISGILLAVVAAPALNALADRRFRQRR
jgi:hypothetical protein